MRGSIPPFPSTSSWCGTSLRTGTNLPLLLCTERPVILCVGFFGDQAVLPVTAHGISKTAVRLRSPHG